MVFSCWFELITVTESVDNTVESDSMSSAADSLGRETLVLFLTNQSWFKSMNNKALTEK